jgi:aldehyde:ferredoxin oxidoreductase
MFGWTGKILYIDLTSKKTGTIRPDEAILHKFIGGKGLAGHYLREYITKPWDSPDMPLLFFTGPLVDTPSPTSGRMTIASKSPLTGTVGDTSVGGKLGTQIKRAGWDGIIVSGKSRRMCGIEIVNDKVKFADAEKMQGMEISRVSEKLGKQGSFGVMGPAAENGVHFANIMVDGHYAAGRSGLGLVMAEKNLKYLKVRGTQRTSLYNREEVMKAREEIFRLAAASPILKGELGIANFGTGAIYDLTHSRRMMPTDNFRATRFSHAEKMNAFQYKQKYDTKKNGCAGCHILCKKKGKKGQVIPEFETMSHFSALINNTDMAAVVEANRICNEMGMDTITAGATLACFSEIEDKKLSPNEITGLLLDIGHSKGHGEKLKLGSLQYARQAGRIDASISVKGLELPAYDPRGAYGMALGYAMSTRGGCHLRAYPIAHEILRRPVATDRFTFSGKARIIKISEDANAIIDSLIACKFLFFGASLEEYARAFYGVTGVKTTGQDLLKIGERIYYHDRCMNGLNGFAAKDDDLPGRFFKEPGTHGDGMEINPIPRQDFLKARTDYYRVRGLDENGMVLKEKCGALGLKL